MRIVSIGARTVLVFVAVAAVFALGVGGAGAAKPAHALFALSPIEAALASGAGCDELLGGRRRSPVPQRTHLQLDTPPERGRGRL